MHGIAVKNSFARPISVYFFAGLTSLLLSYWSTFKNAIVNPDAICYLQSAEAMSLGLNTAMHLCGQAKWPLFSALIYSVTKVTDFSFISSAYLLDGLFSLMSVLTFISIAYFIKSSKRIAVLAAIVILAAHEVNAVREYIVRDHGYWAFYLLSIFFLLKYFQNSRWLYGLAWSLSSIIAALFRIEGALFLVLLPFVIFFVTEKPIAARVKSFFSLNMLTMAAILCAGIWFGLHHQSHGQMGRIGELQFQLTHGLHEISQHFYNNAQVISEHVLSKYATHDAALILVLVLVSWYFINVINNLSLIYAVLVFYAWSKALLQSTRATHWVLWGYVIVNVVITSAFLIENMFLSKRYLLALSLTLMIWVPFALDYLCEQWSKQKWPLILASACIVAASLGGIFDFGYSKAYIRDAGLWLAQNTPPNAQLYSNDYQLMYYSQHFGNQIFSKSHEYSAQDIMANGKWKQFDYIALRINKRDHANTKELGSPVQVFANKRGDEVNIYKIR